MKIVKYIGITLIVLLLLFFSIGLVKPSFEYSAAVTISAAPKRCWTALHDTIGMKRWMPGFQHLTLKEGMDMQLGATYEIIIVRDKRYVMRETVREVKPEEYISYELVNDVMKSEYDFKFTINGSATKITNQNQVIGNNLLWRSILFLSKSYLQNEAQQQLESLKLDVETHEVEFD